MNIIRISKNLLDLYNLDVCSTEMNQIHGSLCSRCAVFNITNQWRAGKNLTEVSNPRHLEENTFDAKTSNQNATLLTLFLTTLPRASNQNDAWKTILFFF